MIGVSGDHCRGARKVDLDGVDAMNVKLMSPSVTLKLVELFCNMKSSVGFDEIN